MDYAHHGSNRHRTRLARLAAWLLSNGVLFAGVAGAAASSPPGPASAWREHTLPATAGTEMLALASRAGAGTAAALYRDGEAVPARQLRLAVLDEPAEQSMTLAPVPAPARVHGPAALVLDAAGTIHVATSAEGGGMRLLRLHPGRPAAQPGNVPVIGGGTVQVGALRLARQGNLMVAGASGSQGFVAAVSPQGELQWRRTFDELATVLDIIDSDDGYLVAGGMRGEIFPDAVWLGRLGKDGAALGGESRPGPTRYARLATDGRRIGLLYERLAPGLESGSVVLELFAGGSSAALKQPARQTIFEGRLAAPFALAGGGGRFTAAGVADHGRLQVFDIDAAGKVAALYRGQAKAPAYTRYHSIDVVRGATAAWLAGLRSRADGQRRQFELVFSRVPDQ